MDQNFLRNVLMAPMSKSKSNWLKLGCYNITRISLRLLCITNFKNPTQLANSVKMFNMHRWCKKCSIKKLVSEFARAWILQKCKVSTRSVCYQPGYLVQFILLQYSSKSYQPYHILIYVHAFHSNTNFYILWVRITHLARFEKRFSLAVFGLLCTRVAKRYDFTTDSCVKIKIWNFRSKNCANNTKKGGGDRGKYGIILLNT